MRSPCCSCYNHLDKCPDLKFQGWQNLFFSSSLGLSKLFSSLLWFARSNDQPGLKGKAANVFFLEWWNNLSPQNISHYCDCWSTCRFNPFFRTWELVFILLIITLGPRSPCNETPKRRRLCWWAPAPRRTFYSLSGCCWKMISKNEAKHCQGAENQMLCF